eukprot:CAMPEP_0119125666 /NCGR_PEP_ID=MMETSP1310-20130426/4868_1 /TAXON_ID=464262 /ORGANISM="Genus nov. species nov., Strain RCC2339" /LENGTH=173 /DNA_ID=CAMNT_0007115759 /DNA_START=8 /DNA_END=529 /DNA_ORIENTATION=+
MALRLLASTAARAAGRRVEGLRGLSAGALDSIDPAGLSDQTKRELGSLRKALGTVRSAVDAGGKAPDAIDWKQYEDSIDGATLKVFKDALANYSVPKYDGTEVADLKSAFATLEAEAKDAAAQSEARIAALEQELKDIEAAKVKLATKTVDEELASDPELAAKIDKEIMEGNW